MQKTLRSTVHTAVAMAAAVFLQHDSTMHICNWSHLLIICISITRWQHSDINPGESGLWCSVITFQLIPALSTENVKLLKTTSVECTAANRVTSGVKELETSTAWREGRKVVGWEFFALHPWEQPCRCLICSQTPSQRIPLLTWGWITVFLSQLFCGPLQWKLTLF